MCIGSLFSMLGNTSLCIWIGLEFINFIGISGILLIGILYQDFIWIKIGVFTQLFSCMVAFRYNAHSEQALINLMNKGSGEIIEDDNSG